MCAESVHRDNVKTEGQTKNFTLAGSPQSEVTLHGEAEEQTTFVTPCNLKEIYLSLQSVCCV